MAHLLALLRLGDIRLLTLTGPGGVGKTRLSIALAHTLQPDFSAGVYFVSLAAINHADFVLPAIARALGLREAPVEVMVEEFQEIFGSRASLLMLDNFEHVLSAAWTLSALLAGCPHLTILVTSRAPLHLYGEHEFPVLPLPLPEQGHLLTHSSIEEYAALSLFVMRAQALRPYFQATELNIHLIAEICLRLDGLPLAIELAAARLRLFSLRGLLARLSHRLEVLTGGARDLPARQQTLRATIAWSYYLLSEEEQKLFRWLSICAGGCILQTATLLAQAAGLATNDVPERVSVLLENHLLRQVEQSDGEQRLFQLETLREYGLECLQEQGELAAAQLAHARIYLELAQEAEPHLIGPEQVLWLNRLDQELENWRAVFLRASAGGEEEVEWALCLGTKLAQFWYVRGYASDGHRWLDWMLMERRGKAEVRAQALNQAARLAIWRDEYELAQRVSKESLALYRQAGDVRGMALSLFWLGDAAQDRSSYAHAHTLYEEALEHYQQVGDLRGCAYVQAALAYGATCQGHFARARALAQEALAIFREQGDKQGTLYALIRLIRCLYLSQNETARAQRLAQECLALSQKVGYKQGIAAALSYLGLLALQEGDAASARTLLEEAQQLRLELSSPWGIARGTYYLARLHLIQRDYPMAYQLYRTALTMVQEIGDREFLACCLEELAATLIFQASAEARVLAACQAGRLWGNAEQLREEIAAPLPPVHRPLYEQAMALVESVIGEQALKEHRTQGRSMTPEQALSAPAVSATLLAPPDQAASSASADAEKPAAVPASDVAPTPLFSLTKGAPGSLELTEREIEVLRWLVQGWSDAQIARQLVISPRTVNRHTTSIYSKLGVHSRAAATHLALEYHLFTD